MSLTSTPLYCPEWGCQQIEAHKSYTVKAGGVRQLYYCPECGSLGITVVHHNILCFH
jgi:hypothetical protein